MSSLVAILPPAIRRKWDALAIPQLCEALLQQDATIDRLDRADADADYWREQLMRLQEQFAEHAELGLTQSGDLTLVLNCSAARALTANESY